MSFNTFGHIFRVTTWGESHGRALGATVDGCPPGVPVTEDAIQHFRRASSLRPDDYQAPLLVAQSLEDLGRHQEAATVRRRGVAIAEDRLRLSPDDVRALYMGANGLVGLGEIRQGLEWARRARALAPEDPMLLYNLAWMHARL